jgi:hypothetical protein
MEEGLTRCIKEVIRDGSLINLEIHWLNHLAYNNKFVDDSILMGILLVREAHASKEIFHEFSQAFDTSINNAKSQLFFFNTPLVVQKHISCVLGFPRSSFPFKYFGIPLIDNDLCNSSCDGLLCSLNHCLSSWTFRLLNLSSRIMILKYVLQAIPIYLFSSLAEPKSFIKVVCNIQHHFLWSSSRSALKWDLVKWDKI